MLELKKVSKNNYFNNLNITFTAGEIYYTNCLVLIPAMLHLVKIDSGEILYFDRCDKRSFIKSLNTIGYSGELKYKNHKHTVLEYLKYSNSFYSPNYDDNINEYLKIFNLDANKTISELDLCEQKKLSTINALYHEPKIIMLTDPFKNADYNLRLTLTSVLYEQKRKGSIIIYYAKELEQVLITDKAIIIDNSELQDIDINKIKSFKRVTINTSNLDTKRLESINTYNLDIDKLYISFITDSPINDILRKLDYLDLNDIYITNPSIKEILDICKQN